MTNVNINLIREDDIIHLENGEIFEVKETWNANGVYQCKVNYNDKEIVLSYNILGESLEDKSLNITRLEMIEKPDDKIPYYIPRIDVVLLPVLTINGEDMFIYRLVDLDGLEVKGNQTLKASYKHTIEIKLQKKLGRTLEVLKENKIICESEEDCRKRVEAFENQLIDVDTTNEKVGREFYNKIIGVNELN